MTDVTVISFIVYYTLLVYLGLDENIHESRLDQDPLFYWKYFFVIHFGTSLTLLTKVCTGSGLKFVSAKTTWYAAPIYLPPLTVDNVTRSKECYSLAITPRVSHQLGHHKADITPVGNNVTR